MSWKDFFQSITIIHIESNKPHLIERKGKMLEMTFGYRINASFYPAIADANGIVGLNYTMKSIFEGCLKHNIKKILVLEDDAVFIQDPNKYMPAIVKQLDQRIWDICYLGINMDNPDNIFENFADTNLLPVRFAYATHAVAYNQGAMKRMMELYNCKDETTRNANMETPFDVLLNRVYPPAAECLRCCTYPLLATQRSGYSDIEKKELTYEFIEERYNHSISHLVT